MRCLPPAVGGGIHHTAAEHSVAWPGDGSCNTLEDVCHNLATPDGGILPHRHGWPRNWVHYPRCQRNHRLIAIIISGMMMKLPSLTRHRDVPKHAAPRPANQLPHHERAPRAWDQGWRSEANRAPGREARNMISIDAGPMRKQPTHFQPTRWDDTKVHREGCSTGFGTLNHAETNLAILCRIGTENPMCLDFGNLLSNSDLPPFQNIGLSGRCAPRRGPRVRGASLNLRDSPRPRSQIKKFEH